MHPMRRIELIRSTLADGEEGAAEIRAAARLLERTFSSGEVLGAVADPDFPGALVAAAQGCGASEEHAWLTLAAAGPRRARQVMAWRASELVDADQLTAVAGKKGRARRRGFRRLASGRGEAAAAAGAWALLAHLHQGELRRLVRARPVLAVADRRARASRALRPALG